MKYMFTEEVRSSLAQARQQAIRLGHDYVGTEHMLLGVLETKGGMEILERAGVSADVVQRRTVAAVRRGTGTVAVGELPYTSRAKKALEFATAEAGVRHSDAVETLHLLGGLLREEKGIAARVLTELGVTIAALYEGGRLERPDRSPAAARSGIAAPRQSGTREDAVWFLEVDTASTSPIYEQIIARIEEAVATGRLRPGERLPSVRELADELNVAPGTIARAYAALGRKRTLETEGARGTRVADRAAAANGEHDETLTALLRPVVVAAFHMGVDAKRLRGALDAAMEGIFSDGD
jgi:DNA-binding transcriptional regulator YhcF (GntR family)